MKNVGISTGHCGFTDTFSNNIINDLQSSFTLLCFFMRRFSPIEYGIYIIGGDDMDKAIINLANTVTKQKSFDKEDNK